MEQSPFLPTAYFKGQFVPFEQANVSIATHALQYGSGVFGGIRGYLDDDGHTLNLFRVPDHARRLCQSAGLLGIGMPFGAEGLTETIVELVNRNRPASDVYIRPFAYKSGLNIPPGMAGVDDGLAIFMLPLGRYHGDGSKGLSLQVSAWRRIEDTAIPARGKVSGAYVNSSLAKDDAVAQGFDDAVLLNENGSVAEASTCNLAIVRDGILITPPVSDNILEGITRRSMLHLATELGIPVIERSVDRTELYIADEVLLFGTAVEVSWAESVDKRTISHGQAGPVFQQLSSAFAAIVRGQSAAYGKWLTRVTF
jgi:branched-chain amino acid aminotransferase